MSDSDHVHGHTGQQFQPSHVTHKAQDTLSLGCVVITCSDSRTRDTDTSGKLICHLLKGQGHTIVDYQILKDEPADITEHLQQTIRQNTSHIIIINGGTGISKRDSTFEAVDGLLEKSL